MKRLIPLFLIVISGHVFPQSPDWDQRVAFAENIRRIKYWAIIEGDTTFNCYSDVVSAIEETLNRKGYESKRLFFEPGNGSSSESWKARQIKALASNEAFLEIRVSIRADSSGERGGPSTLMVQDASGRVYAQHSLRPENEKTVDYTSISKAFLYLKKAVPDLAPSIPFYSKQATVSGAGVDGAARNSVRGIPGSRNPVTKKKPAYLNKEGFTTFEFAIYGGYCSGGTIAVTGGKTIFRPGPDYGLEFMVNIYKGLDISIGYKREDAFAKTEAQRYPREGDLALSNNYILISSIYRFFHKKSFQPYVGFDFGSVNVVMKDKFFRDVWYFAVGGRAGCNWFVTKVIGFRLQTQLLYQVHPRDAPFLYSEEIRVMPYVINAESNLLQYDATIGLLIRLGK